MIKKQLLRFLTLFLVLFVVAENSSAQWQQTNGPFGGNLSYITYSNGDLYVGTNRSNIFRLRNNTWERLSYIYYAEELVQFNSVLFARSSYGLYSSNDHGTTWQVVMEGNASAFYQNQNYLFASVNDSIYKTSNGIDWENALLGTSANTILFGQPTVQNLVDIKAFAVIDSLALLGCTTSVYPVPQGIYVTNDKGVNWLFASGIKDPTYASDFEVVNNSFYLSSSNGISKSTDNGVTWTSVNYGLPAGYSGKMLNINSELFTISFDDHDIYRLSDTTWSSLNTGMTITDMCTDHTDIYFISAGSVYQLSLQNNNITDLGNGLIATSYSPFVINSETVLTSAYNKYYRTENGGDSWQENNQYSFTKFSLSGDKVIAIGSNGIFKSSDMGLTWNASSSGIPGDFVNSAQGLASKKDTIFVGFNRLRPRTHLTPVWEAGGVYRSVDNGQTWTLFSTGLPSQASVRVPVRDIYTCDDHLIINTYDGLYRSTNNGSSWSLFESGLAQYAYAFRFIGFNDRIYSITNKGIYYSQKNESAWVEADDGLPFLSNPLAIYTYRFLSYQNNLYLMTSQDTLSNYQFENGSWTAVTGNFPAGVEFNEFQSFGDVIYAGTIDAGIWKGNLGITSGITDNELTADDFVLSQNYPNPFNPSTKIQITVPQTEFVSLKVYNILGQEVATLVSDKVTAGSYNYIWNASDFASGVYFYRFAIHSDKLDSQSFTQIRKMMLVK